MTAHSRPQLSMSLRLVSPTSTLPPFSLSPPHSPSSSSDAARSPQAALLPASEMHIFGLQPLEPDIGHVSCAHCRKPILKSAILEHTGKTTLSMSAVAIMWTEAPSSANCKKIREGGPVKTNPTSAPASQPSTAPPVSTPSVATDGQLSFANPSRLLGSSTD